MISMAKIMGGTAGTSGLTKHLMNNTLTPDAAKMAAYYARGAVIDTDMLEAAQAIADGTMTYSEAADYLSVKYLADGHDINGLEAYEERTSDRLSALALRISDGLQDAPVAVINPNIHPVAAAGLDIQAGDILSPVKIDALLAGRRADNEPIEGKTYAKERRLPVNPRTGADKRSMPIGSFDFTVTPHKSVSVAWAFSNDLEGAKIFNAHIEASRDAVSYITDKIGRARTGAGGRADSEQGHVAVLEFTHHTSRTVTQTIEDGVSNVTIDRKSAADPDLHTHHLVINAVFTESGRVGSLDSAAIRGLRYEADALYHARLGTKLRDAGFGVTLDERTGSARMSAIPEEVSKIFSKRTNMGEALARKDAADRGEDWDTLPHAERATRTHAATQHWEQKEKGGKDEVANFADWQRQAEEFGWKPPASFLAYGPPAPERSPEVQHREAYEIAQERLAARLEEKSVLTHHELRTAAFQGLIHSGNAGGIADADAVTKLMREEGVMQYGERTALAWGQETDKRHVSVTTELHESHEAEFIALGRAAAQDRSGAIPTRILERAIASSGLDFTDDHGKTQLEAIRRLASGGRFGVAIGTAGSGKTTAVAGVLTAAWREQGRDVHGASLAWRQADALAVDAGIDRRNVKAFSILMTGIEEGTIKLTKKSVVVIDELALLGTRQGLELLRLREKYGFSVVALGDDKQVTSIAAGQIVDLSRMALGSEQIPEILTTKRQQSQREQLSVGLLRDGRAAEYLQMKRDDGTAELVPGRAEDVIRRVAKLYGERLKETGQAPSIAAPTNSDARLIGQAVRDERRRMDLLGPDLRTVRATDGEREYSLSLAKGDRLRLFKSTGADYGNGTGGAIARNGSVVEVMDVTATGITVKAASGQVGHVDWEKITDTRSGRVLAAYGDCQTIHTSQGSTAQEHIIAWPRGSKEVSAGTAYSTGTRHRRTSYLLTSAMSEHVEVKASRPRNDIRPITDEDRWAHVAERLIAKQEKDLASTLGARTDGLRRGTVRYFHHVMGQSRSDMPDLVQRRRVEELAIAEYQQPPQPRRQLQA